jgi:hypothetical protein
VPRDGRGIAAARGVRAYRGVALAFAVAFVLIGIALVVRAARAGAIFPGVVIGVLFVALGVGRLALLRRR